jgi:hypothetical protein
MPMKLMLWSQTFDPYKVHFPERRDLSYKGHLIKKLVLFWIQHMG